MARLAPAIGVTRIAVQTGLDVIGLPVAAAFRPNSRTVAAHTGKGATLAQAKVSALMEALECFCAETLMLPLRLGDVREMAAFGPVLDVARLPRCRGGPDPAGERLLWVEGERLGGGGPVWVPREVVAADYAWPSPPGAGVFQATTTGLASGNTEAEAVLHGLCEVIERDALTLWNARSPGVRAASRVAPASVAGRRAAPLIQLCEAVGVAVAIADVTSDVGVPVLAVVLRDRDGTAAPELGAACHPDPDVALAGALAEAAQARVTVIAGARDDIDPEAFEPPGAAARASAAAAWSAGVPRRRMEAVAALRGADPVAAVLDRLRAVGCAEAALVRLGRPELDGVPVVRVVVPGLEGPDEGEHAPGARLAAIRAVGHAP